MRDETKVQQQNLVTNKQKNRRRRSDLVFEFCVFLGHFFDLADRVHMEAALRRGLGLMLLLVFVVAEDATLELEIPHLSETA